MAVYFVTGKLGAGKTLAALTKIREYLWAGRRVATNLDLWMESLVGPTNRAVVERIPDIPDREHLEALGPGCEEQRDEKKYGLLVLDELATYLNARTWQDKKRLRLIDWFRHSRKHRWDIIFLVQDIDSLDPQLVKALGEHVVYCRRSDKMPFVGKVMPKMHVATVYYGRGSSGMKVDRWVYRGTDLYDAYDTEQVISEDVEYYDSGPVDMRASFTYLSAWHLKGRYIEPSPSAIEKLNRFALPPIAQTVILAALGWYVIAGAAEPEITPVEAAVGQGEGRSDKPMPVAIEGMCEEPELAEVYITGELKAGRRVNYLVGGDTYYHDTDSMRSEYVLTPISACKAELTARGKGCKEIITCRSRKEQPEPTPEAPSAAAWGAPRGAADGDARSMM